MGLFGDDFLAGIQKQAESVVSNVTQNVGEFFQGQVKNTLVKIGPAPAGNLSPAEIESGKRGSTTQLAPSQSAPESIARAAAVPASAAPSKMAYLIPALAGVAAALFFFRRK